MNIYSKLILLCTFLVIFTSASIFYFADGQVESTLGKSISQQLSQQALHKINSIDRFIYQRLSDIETIAKDPVLRSPSSKASEVNQRLVEFQELNELYYSFSYFDLNRIRIADSKNKNIGEKHSYSKYWTRFNLNTPVVMDISKSESIGKFVIHFGSVVKNDEGNAIGFVVSRVLIDRMYDILVEPPLELSLPPNAALDLVDRYGRLLYSSHNPQAIMEEKYDKKFLLNKMGEQKYGFYESKSHIFFFAQEQGYLSFKGNAWYLIIRVPKEQAFTPLKRIRWQLFYMLIPVLFISILLTFLVAHLFVNPIIRLSQAAERIGQGHLNTRIDVSARDEVGKLGRQFKQMAERLIKRIEETEFQKEKIAEQNKKITHQAAKLSQALEEIQIINEQITSSISYAERIQRSMLPDTKILDQMFSDSFILYEPRDIVSGDFYWFEKIYCGNKKYFVMAGADCTGHGVPGSIMAMLGSNLLTNIITYGKMVDPVEILRLLNRYIIMELHQDENFENSQDGMEVAICVIDLDTLKMEFSGGFRPLYLFREGKLQEYKGDKIILGGVGQLYQDHYLDFQFTKHSIQVQPGDRLYIFSDGYHDQFGGTQDKKYMTKNFKSLLQKIHQVGMDQQKNILAQEHQNWKRKTPQTDDILVMGFKI